MPPHHNSTRGLTFQQVEGWQKTAYQNCATRQQQLDWGAGITAITYIFSDFTVTDQFFWSELSGKKLFISQV